METSGGIRASLAGRYASALFDLARDQRQIESVGNSLDAEAVIQRITKFTRPINYLGLPSLSIPTGFTGKGLPVGMQLIGRPFDEAGLTRIGAAFQRATDYHQRIPKPA